MRLYVIGAEGQVARSLREAASEHPGVTFGFSSRPTVDILDSASVATAISAFRPDVVVNPAAYTAVDRAEDEPERAFAINRDGAQTVARITAQRGLPIIHLSTDYVFDGSKQAAYLETDDVNPQGVYGESKLAGEIAVTRANPRHVILRTSWVYAPFGGNFVCTMLRLAAKRDRLRVVNDQKGCPTYAPDIAEAVISIAIELVTWRDEYAGLTHLSGPDAMTWFDFAREIFRQSAIRGGPCASVDPIAASEYPTRAVRPANSQLSTQRLRSLFGGELPSTEASLANCLDRILAKREIQ
ncbi:dTDP-4-dehydrorhamnose reductase [Bradyrhizobium barranii subsp. apii]|uniref:dTDP-4-dehydrorhamnose reductase n=1 Tax=Bradyrhizobium barranii TaxID=2992140 RepID=UPI001AA0CAF0|nr:dTDP-4-dehydrorhamnose reductase [Bradyrhizobium barranii]UPT96071.1 dTDP-4-dehydrorhamnose reductase [Bradyrhizobium barranii subsp. apii]